MSYLEEIQKLRRRLSDAVEKGVVNSGEKQFLEATLIQVMNDSEKNRQNCAQQAENLRRQAAIMDGQAGAFASVSSIVYSVINGFVVLAEKEEEERKLVEEEKKAEESETAPVVEPELEAKKKTNKKR